MIIKTSYFFIIYVFHLIPLIVQTTQLYFLAHALTQCWITWTKYIKTWIQTVSFILGKKKKIESHPLTSMFICARSLTLSSSSPGAELELGVRGSPQHKVQVSTTSHSSPQTQPSWCLHSQGSQQGLLASSRHLTPCPLHLHSHFVTFALSYKWYPRFPRSSAFPGFLNMLRERLNYLTPPFKSN